MVSNACIPHKDKFNSLPLIYGKNTENYFPYFYKLLNDINFNLNKERSTSENLSSNEIRTTDVNILLNRVRLDKKKTFKKRLIISFVTICFVVLVVNYLIM